MLKNQSYQGEYIKEGAIVHFQRTKRKEVGVSVCRQAKINLKSKITYM